MDQFTGGACQNWVVCAYHSTVNCHHCNIVQVFMIQQFKVRWLQQCDPIIVRKARIMYKWIVSGCIGFYLWPVVDREMSISNIIAIATTSTWVTQILVFQLRLHNSSKVWTFNVGRKYGLKILLFSNTFLFTTQQNANQNTERYWVTYTVSFLHCYGY